MRRRRPGNCRGNEPQADEHGRRVTSDDAADGQTDRRHEHLPLQTVASPHGPNQRGETFGPHPSSIACRDSRAQGVKNAASIRHIHGANVDRGLLGERRPKMVEWQLMAVLPGEETMPLAGLGLLAGFRRSARSESVNALQHLRDSCSTDAEVSGECSSTFESARVQESLVVTSQFHAVWTLVRGRLWRRAFVDKFVPRMEHDHLRSL